MAYFEIWLVPFCSTFEGKTVKRGHMRGAYVDSVSIAAPRYDSAHH